MPGYQSQYENELIDLQKTPRSVRAIFERRAAGYSRDLMEGADPPYATEEEYMEVLGAMVSRSRVRVEHGGGCCRIIDRRAVLFTPSCEKCYRVPEDRTLVVCQWCGGHVNTRPEFSDGGWLEVSRHAVAELIRLGYIKRFQEERELDRIGWREMGWDGDVADWYGWPA
jgi:hypothetical protein